LIIDFQGGSIVAGGFGTVDVFISSNADIALPDNLDSFSWHFLISPIGSSTPGGLRFVDPQADAQLAASNYVFDGDSLGQDFGGPLGTVSTFLNTNDTFIGGDATLTGTGVDLNNVLGQFLLARLNLDASLANVGDQYSLALINDPFTDFLNSSFDPVSLDASSFNAFTVTAVPEPTSLLLVSASGAIAFGIQYRKRRKSLGDQAAELARSQSA
jgi:hypothetical protein